MGNLVANLIITTTRLIGQTEEMKVTVWGLRVDKIQVIARLNENTLRIIYRPNNHDEAKIILVNPKSLGRILFKLNKMNNNITFIDYHSLATAENFGH